MMSRIAPITLLLMLAACGDNEAEEVNPAVVEQNISAASGSSAAPAATPPAADAAVEPGEAAPPAAEPELPTPAATATTSAATPAAAPAAQSSTAPAARPSAAPSPKPSATPVAAAAAGPPAAFNQCKACHSVKPGDSGIGPSLANVFGAKAGHMAGYDYSEAMESANVTWNEQNLNNFLADPRGVIPGTKMIFPGIKDAEKRQAIVDYLKTL